LLRPNEQQIKDAKDQHHRNQKSETAARLKQE
jgi:hypothetical protein